jgi:hypothetical protein
MKNLFFVLLFAGVQVLNGQAPQLINYQAVVRGINTLPVPSGTHVSLRFTIHDGSPAGNAVFSEVQMGTTNQFGLVSVQIGSVTNLGGVNWSSGAKYLQVELDPTGALISRIWGTHNC